MGCCCVERQLGYFRQNCQKFTLFYRQKSHQKFLKSYWQKQNTIQIGLIKKVQGEQKIQTTKTVNDDGSILIKSNIDEQGIINQGIFQNLLNDTLSQQFKSGIKCIRIKQPQCDSNVDMNKIYTLVVKGILDANQKIMKTKFAPLPKQKTIVLVYWQQVPEKIAHKLIINVLQEFQ